MGFVATTIQGGFPDPEATGEEAPGTMLYAVNEYMPFTDAIEINLIAGEFTSYGSISNISVTVSVDGTPLTGDELTGNGATSLNISYSTPNPSTVEYLTINTTFDSSSGNITITGNVQNAFPDKYFEFKDFRDEGINVVNSTANIPDEDVALYLYKPSFMRYINIYYNVVVEYDTGPITYVIPKKVVNDWSINRQAMLFQIQREQAYRANNYPKGY